MKFVLILLALLAVAGFLVVAAKNKKGEGGKLEEGGEKSYEYFRRKPLTENEQVIYWRLIQALPDHIVLPQVGMSRCIETKTKAAFGTISQKSLDFVVCNKASEIIAAIEIDDKSHNSKSRKKADETKDIALATAGIHCIRWKASDLPSETEIKVVFGQPIDTPLAIASSRTAGSKP